MFERFLGTFAVTSGSSVQMLPAGATAGKWMDQAGGRTYENGLYRVHTKESARAADALARAAFPEFAGRLACFGYDWLGRQFATDMARGSGGDPEVLMFEPGTGEVLEIPVPFSAFHDGELVDYGEEALARGFFVQWLQTGGPSPKLNECIGYRKPLFLGGQDVVANLELSDLDVYWTIMGQLRRRAMRLPEGTPVSHVRGEP
jgi:Domain of unknown function (DUF1851)